MLRWALVFLVVALLAGALGMFRVEWVAAEIAWILFAVFLILFVVSLVLGRRGSPPLTLVFALVLLGSSQAGETDVNVQLIGYWEVVKSEDAPVGSSVEFTKDGKLILIPKGKEDKKIEARYKVEGKKFRTTRKEKDKEEVNVLTIQTLDETTLITLSDKGKTDELKRVKGK